MKKAIILLPVTILMLVLMAFVGCVNKQTEKKDVSATAFELGKPVWKTGDQFVMNQTLGFRGLIEAPSAKTKTILRLTGSSLYRVFLNGEFVGHGPARAGHGYYRVDELDITELLKTGQNIVAIEIVGYNTNSYYLLDVPSFLQAEVQQGDKVVLATLPKQGENAFEVSQVEERIQKVARYSFQRTYTESYVLTPESYKWMTDMSAPFKKITCENVGEKKLIPRRINYSLFEVIYPDEILYSGKVKRGVKQKKYVRDRYVAEISDVFKGFYEKDFTLNTSIDLQEIENVEKVAVNKKYDGSKPIKLGKEEFKIINFDYNASGFIGATIKCTKPGRLYFVFDEILMKEDINFLRLTCINAVSYDLVPGEYHIETIEPYTMKYLKVLMVEGECEVSDIYIREYTNPDIYKAKFESSSVKVNNVFKAGLENFRQNVVDIPMDCPSRERSGWLCDSYFSPRAAVDISGHADVEKKL